MLDCNGSDPLTEVKKYDVWIKWLGNSSGVERVEGGPISGLPTLPSCPF